MSTREATYTAYIDWFGHGGLNMGLAGWHTSDLDTDATLELSTEQFIRDGQSIKLSGDNPEMYHAFNAEVGQDYTVTAWVYNVDAARLFFTVRTKFGGGIHTTIITTTQGEWVEVSHSFTATEDGYYLELGGDPGTWYLGWSKVVGEHDDVTCDLLESVTVPRISYGRDDAEDLATISAGTANIGLKNTEGKYSPGNTASPIAEGLIPNRPVLIEATHDSETYVLFSGYIDDMQVQASPEEQNVDISCTDLIGRLQEIPVNTAVYESIRTGDAVTAILEQTELWAFLTNIPASIGSTTLFNPFIDTGASTLRWWAFSGDAKAALDGILRDEGLPALYSVGSSNQIIFRDRLHRQRTGYDYNPVTEFSGDCTPGTFPVGLESGPEYPWSRVVNKITSSYNNMQPADEYTDVWQDKSTISWGEDSLTTGDDADFYTFTGTADNGYIEAQDPIKGVLQFIENAGPEETDVQAGILPEDHDYVALSDTADDSTVDFIDDAEHPMTRSGTAVAITLQHTNDIGSPSVVKEMTLRARAIESETLTFNDEISGSVQQYKSESGRDLSFGPVVRSDAEAVTRLYLKHNAFLRPTLVIKIKNSTSDHLDFILSADLSQSVRVNVSQWYLDNVFTIEKIEHDIGQKGGDHSLTMHLLQQRLGLSDNENEFTFDEEGMGFDDGVFASQVLNPDTVFILGQSELNSTDVLSY